MYKYSACVILFNIILVLFSGCGEMLLPEMYVNSYTYDKEKFSIQFSDVVDKTSLIRAVSLSEDGQTIACTYEFEGNIARIFPENGIRDNYDYILIISTLAENKRGCSLNKNFVYSISRRKESEKPEIVSVTPGNDSKVQTELNEIVIDFNEGINRESFERSFSIEPSVKYVVDFIDDNKTVIVYPVEALTVNQEYKIRISKNLEDLCRNTLADDYSSMFYYKFDNAKPDLEVTAETNDEVLILSEVQENKNLCLDTEFYLRFSKEMKLSNAASFITIIPPLSYSIIKDDYESKFLNLKCSGVEWGKTYSLLINEGFTDTSGNKVNNKRSYRLTFDNEKNRPVTFLEGYFQIDEFIENVPEISKFKIINEATNYGNLVFKPVVYPVSEEKNCCVYLVFGCSKESDGIDLFSILDAVQINATNSCCSFDIRTMHVLSDEEIEEEGLRNIFSEKLCTTQEKISVVKVLLQLQNSSNEGTVNLILESKIRDTLGNSMLKDKKFIFNK